MLRRNRRVTRVTAVEGDSEKNKKRVIKSILGIIKHYHCEVIDGEFNKTSHS